jgi:hypothetical protein
MPKKELSCHPIAITSTNRLHLISTQGPVSPIVLFFYVTLPTLQFPFFHRSFRVPHISNDAYDMISISFFKSLKTSWVKYKRVSKIGGAIGEHFYAHCMCKTETMHGTMDVRYFATLLKSEHECFPPAPREMTKQFDLWQHRYDQEIFSVEKSDQEKHATETQLDTVCKYWVLFQNSKHLSFSAVTSPEFNRLAASFVRLGQENPHIDPGSLVPDIKGKKFVRLHHQLAEASRTETFSKFRGEIACLCFDATRMDYRNFIVACLVNKHVSSPRVYCLKEKVNSQQDYAHFAADIIMELIPNCITIGSICTDGLRCQVNAVAGTYTGFLILCSLIQSLSFVISLAYIRR